MVTQNQDGLVRVPVATQNTEDPTIRLHFLGIELDVYISKNSKVGLSQDKLRYLQDEIMN